MSRTRSADPTRSALHSLGRATLDVPGIPAPGVETPTADPFPGHVANASMMGVVTAEYSALDATGPGLQAVAATVTVPQGGSAAVEFNVLAPSGTVIGRQPPGTTTRRFYYTDLLGSTRAVVTETGAFVEGRAYDAWGVALEGRLAAPTGPAAREGFTGKARLAETTADAAAGALSGLDDFGARTYAPAYGRFVQIDPHAESYPGWSPYHYAVNNPVSYTDPTGMDYCPASESDCTDGGGVNLADDYDLSCSANKGCLELRDQGYERVNFHNSTATQRAIAFWNYIMYKYRDGTPSDLNLKDIFDFRSGNVEVGTMAGYGGAALDEVVLRINTSEGLKDLDLIMQYNVAEIRGRVPNWATNMYQRPGIRTPTTSRNPPRDGGRLGWSFSWSTPVDRGNNGRKDLLNTDIVRAITFDEVTYRLINYNTLRGRY